MKPTGVVSSANIIKRKLPELGLCDDLVYVWPVFFFSFHRYLPREVDPLVYNMSHEDPGSVSYSEIGGLSEQIRELREVQQK